MSTGIVLVKQRKYRGEVPQVHRTSLDTRIQWLWHQRFGTAQTVWQRSQLPGGDILDQTAATLILQAIMAKDIESISQVFSRLEGGARNDDKLEDDEPTTIRI